VIYNFVVDNILIQGHLETQIFVLSSHILKIFYFYFFKMILDVNMVYTKIIFLNVIYNFVVENIFMDYLED